MRVIRILTDQTLRGSLIISQSGGCTTHDYGMHILWKLDSNKGHYVCHYPNSH